MDSYQE
jgi:dynein heavy chain, axonemal